jgi:hypothetical protein
MKTPGLDELLRTLNGTVRMPRDEFLSLVRSVADSIRSGDNSIEDVSTDPAWPEFRWRRGISKGNTFVVVFMKDSGDGVESDLSFRVRWSDATESEFGKAMKGSPLVSALIGRSKKFGAPRGTDSYVAFLESLASEVRRRGGNAAMTSA